MKKLLVSSLSLAASAMSASSAVVLVAGWDFFDSATTPAATQVGAQTTATLTSNATTGAWGRWNGGAGNAAGESTDETFGNLSTSVATASNAALTGTNSGSNLSLNRASKPGSLIITLTNDSGVDRTLDGFYFDSVGRFAQSAKVWSLTFGGAISGTAAGGTLTEADMMVATPVQRDWAVDLTGLTDNVWEAGQNAIFTLNFTGGASSTGTGGGHETLVDNIGITADVVAIPEPSSFAMLAFGLTGLLLRRRK